MKFLYDAQSFLKNGCYIDYIFKYIYIKIYKYIFKNNFIYLIDKFIAENMYLYLKKFFSFFTFINDFIKKTETLQLIKILLLILLQIIIIII